MEFFTSWPLKHYFSLKLQPNINYYNIDEDTIISEQDAEKFNIKPYRKSDKYLLVGLSKTMGQVFKELGENKVPKIPENIEKIIKQHQEQDDFFMSLMKKNQSKVDSSDTNFLILKEELEKEIAKLKTDLEAEKTLKERLLAKQNETDQSYNDHKLQELSKLQLDNDVKFQELSKLQIDNDVKFQELSKLQLDIDNKLKSYDELNTKEQESELKDKNLLSLETQLSEKQNNLQTLESELSIKESKLQTLTNELSEKQGNLESMKTELSKEQDVLELMKTELCDKQNNLELMKTELSEKQNNLELMKTELSEKQNNLEKEISEKNIESTSISDILKEYQSEKEKYDKQIRDFDTSKSLLESKLLMLEKQYESYFSPDSYQKLQSLLDQTISDNKTDKLNYTNEILNLNSQFSELQSRFASCSSELESLNSQLIDKDSHIDSLNSRLDDTSSLSLLDSFTIKSSAKSILLIFNQSSSLNYFLIPISELKPRHLNSLVFSHGVSLDSSPSNSITTKSALSVIQAISPKNSSHDPDWSGIWYQYQIPLSEVCNFDQLQVFIVSQSS